MRSSATLIDLGALIANYRALQARARPGRALAVVKANAYGHGMVPCATALAPLADGFAVAFTEEGMVLRDHGVSAPIVVLEGPFDEAELAAIVEHRLWPMVHADHQLAWLEGQARRGKLLPEAVWVKVDTGMHRLGFAPQAVSGVAERLLRLGFGRDQIVWVTHLACADDPADPATPLALSRFTTALAALPVSLQPARRSIANSAALLAVPAAASDWARPGIALYGASPFAGEPLPPPFRPVMTLTAPLIATRWIEAGERVGYGGIFTAERPTRVGVVAIGYADGYPRTAPSGTPVAVAGWRTHTIGRVSMDMLAIDLTELPESLGVGSAVELWGQTIPVDTVAARVGTIGYELLCRVQRVAYRYLPP